MTRTRTVTLELDERDYHDFQKEVAIRQARCRVPDPDRPGRSMPWLPENESNLVGAIVGEIVRDLWDYRKISGGVEFEESEESED